MNYLRHFLTPHHTNNFRAKILHNSSLFSIILFFTFLTVGLLYLARVHPSVLGISFSISQSELLQDTNTQREQNGLKSLSINDKLNQAAEAKAKYMISHNFWAHFAPDGTTPWYFIKNSGYDYLYAGENLAKGFTSSQDVVTAWMNSPSHRENMLSSKYNDVGFAIEEGNLLGEDVVLVVEIFGATAQVVTQNSEIQNNSQKIASQETSPQSVKNVLPNKVLQIQSESVVSKPVVNVQKATKSTSIAFLIFIIIILILDIVIVEKNKIPRIVGHNLDHIILLLLFLAFVVITKTGGVL